MTIWEKDGTKYDVHGPWSGEQRFDDPHGDGGYFIARYSAGRLHSTDDQPAFEHFDRNGQIVEQRWAKEGNWHRDKGPSVIEYDDIGGKAKEEYHRWFGWGSGLLHSTDDHPAVIEYRYGTITKQAWYDYDKLHREGDKPALLEWADDGTSITVGYYNRGSLDRENGPALVERDLEAMTETEMWVRNDTTYREDGPAVVECDLIETDDGWTTKLKDAQWCREEGFYEPSAHERLRWHSTQIRQRGPLWQEPDDAPEVVATRSGGVKAAAAAAATKAATTRQRGAKASSQDAR
jgi:hypothetical protein